MCAVGLNNAGQLGSGNQMTNSIFNCSIFLGQDELVLNEYFELYPNPNNGEFYFNLPEKYLGESIKIIIYNSFSKLISEINSLINDKNQLKLELSPGVYFVEIQLENKIFNRKIIVQ